MKKLDKKMLEIKDRYNNEIKKKLMKELGLSNIHTVPRFEKIVLNMGVGESISNPQAVGIGQEILTLVSGQKAYISKSKKSISNFKLRENVPIGCCVTLRKERMWEFYDKLINIVIPRMRDFRGVSLSSFDRQGNYNLGIKDHTIFLEIDPNNIDKIRGFEITLVIKSAKPEHSVSFLRSIGFPLKKI